MSGRARDGSPEGVAVTRRTRSGRAAAPPPAPSPRATRRRGAAPAEPPPAPPSPSPPPPSPPPPPSASPPIKIKKERQVFENAEELEERSKEFRSLIEREQEDSGDFEPQIGRGESPSFDIKEEAPDEPNDESNGIMDGMLAESCLKTEQIEQTEQQSSDDEKLCDLKKSVEDETEVVSEDELPTVVKPEVKDAENVSDDELPGPKPADLPADTEVVSEDELPSAKKEPNENRKRKTEDDPDGYDPGSPTSEGESAPKKPALSKDGDDKTSPSEKRTSEDRTTKKKALPELDKYWKAVNDDAADFTGWTYLLQYVDQENDVEAAREAYDAFLSHYPYCYGYWRKYADYEKRKGSKKKCLEVLERGLRGIPLSVDLWIHYLNHVKTTRTDDHDFIRQQYERALSACGLEFRSDRLWESFIKWETEVGNLVNVTALYGRLLSTPTLGYTTHFDNFQEHITSNLPSACIPKSEFIQLRSDFREKKKLAAPSDPESDIPPSEDEADDHVRSDEEAAGIKEDIVSARGKLHKVTIDQVAQRWNFEEGIKRPYFHVKPLERCQLKNWKAYLEWEEDKGDQTRVLVLYERCLIACALYEEFWLRLVQYLEGQYAIADTPEAKAKLLARARDVLERACTIHHLDKPTLHFRWAFFEEQHGNPARSSEILERLDKTCPNLLQVAYRRINLERRRGDLDKCCQLYEHYVNSSKSKSASSSLSIKYAKFIMRNRDDATAAIKVLRNATAKDPSCQRLYLQMVDIAMTKGFDLNDVIGYLDEYLTIENVDSEARVLFAQRKLEILEELGTSAHEIYAAHQNYQTLLKQYKKKKDKMDASIKKKGDSVQPPLPPSNSTSTTNNTNYNYATNSYGYNAPPPAQPSTQASYDNGTYASQTYQTSWTGYQQPPYQTWTGYQSYY